MLKIDGHIIYPGERKRITLKTARLYDFTETGIPVEIIRGKEDGPTLFISAAIHGDEINGVEIVKRLLCHKSLKKIRGTLIAVPIVNVFGFNTKSRYLPDRRDLNRCFPGSKDGSLAAQIAYIIMSKLVSKANYCIDLHTGAVHRRNVPQLRGSFDNPETKRLAEAFGVPVMIHSSVRDGSLREAVHEMNIPILLFEGGEALRFHEKVIRLGVKGIISVMQAIDMLPHTEHKSASPEPFIAKSSTWVRAPYSGILQTVKKLGQYVSENELLGVVSDPFGEHHFEIHAKVAGIIIGMTMLPLLNGGDAIFHIATAEGEGKDFDKDYLESLLSHADTYVS